MKKIRLWIIVAACMCSSICAHALWPLSPSDQAPLLLGDHAYSADYQVCSDPISGGTKTGVAFLTAPDSTLGQGLFYMDETMTAPVALCTTANFYTLWGTSRVSLAYDPEGNPAVAVSSTHCFSPYEEMRLHVHVFRWIDSTVTGGEVFLPDGVAVWEVDPEDAPLELARTPCDLSLAFDPDDKLVLVVAKNSLIKQGSSFDSRAQLLFFQQMGDTLFHTWTILDCIDLGDITNVSLLRCSSSFMLSYTIDGDLWGMPFSFPDLLFGNLAPLGTPIASGVVRTYALPRPFGQLIAYTHSAISGTGVKVVALNTAFACINTYTVVSMWNTLSLEGFAYESDSSSSVYPSAFRFLFFGNGYFRYKEGIGGALPQNCPAIHNGYNDSFRTNHLQTIRISSDELNLRTYSRTTFNGVEGVGCFHNRP